MYTYDSVLNHACTVHLFQTYTFTQLFKMHTYFQKQGNGLFIRSVCRAQIFFTIRTSSQQRKFRLINSLQNFVFKVLPLILKFEYLFLSELSSWHILFYISEQGFLQSRLWCEMSQFWHI